MLRAWRIHGWATILVALMVTSATAGSNDNDAGSGADAGGSRASATSVAMGSLHEAYLAKNDIDWFAADVGGAGAGCVLLTGVSNVPAYFALAAETPAGTTTAPLRAQNGVPFSAGVAGLMPLTGTLRVRGVDANKQGEYEFRLDSVGVPSGTGDGPLGADAGASPEEAMPAAPGCIGGHLTMVPALDVRDLYRIDVGPDQVVTYSLVSDVEGITLTLVNAADIVVGPIVDPGEYAAVAVPTGAYFLSAQRTNSFGDVGYVAGAIVGPDPTGCRPYCLA